MKYLKLYEELLNTKMKIPSDIMKISKIFTNSGYDLFIVGGAVRDFILKEKPHDFDLVTNAQPRQIEEILKSYPLGLHGRHFAVIRVFTDETPEGIEIASYRKDIVSGRNNKVDPDNPKVEFGRHITIRDDVLRRDLTCNALYYDINKEKIIDIVGGVKDINKNIIRAVGDPHTRIIEDRLRILRTIRFASRTNSTIDDNTSNAIIDDNRLNGLSEEEDVSQERIIKEIYDMLKWSIDRDNLSSWLKYLSLLKYFKLYVRMFPNVRLNTIPINTLNDKLIFTNLFLHNDISNKFHIKMRDEFKLPNDVTDSVIFFLNLIRLFNDTNIHNVFDYNDDFNILLLYKMKNTIGIDNKTISDFGNLFNIDTVYIDNFINYIPTIKSLDLMNIGFSGRELGIEIKKRECEIFKNTINKKIINNG